MSAPLKRLSDIFTESADAQRFAAIALRRMNPDISVYDQMRIFKMPDGAYRSMGHGGSMAGAALIDLQDDRADVVETLVAQGYMTLDEHVTYEYYAGGDLAGELKLTEAGRAAYSLAELEAMSPTSQRAPVRESDIRFDPPLGPDEPDDNAPS